MFSLEDSELVSNATRLLARQFPSWVKLAQLRELRFTTTGGEQRVTLMHKGSEAHLGESTSG